MHNCIPRLATKALMYEVSLSPKPGLVDRLNNGSHRDMNFFTFVDSVLSFEPFFKQYYELGRSLQQTNDLNGLFKGSRRIGINAEIAMFEATRGINTHKGANFSFALLLVAVGYIIEREQLSTWSASHTTEAFQLIRLMTKDTLLKDFDDIHTKEHLSHGERLYIEHGITGIRGEAVSGYPILQDVLMPYLRSLDNPMLEHNLLKALMLIMGHIEDGNIIHRGGFEAWETIKIEALELFNQQSEPRKFLESLHEYDQVMIERHLSPGGAADALALGIFLSLLEQSEF
ncbi:triphosphoribosyl-dephospho-CoA synthase CitG [Aerococcaceae bacterium DSM 111021]|nr:triphosphoribosyl-dephospho-CoA synthase CitG [Aerococcaceae bacterium DSM 111021]